MATEFPTTLDALARELADGRRTSRALVTECLERIAAPDGEGPRTFLKVQTEQALATAEFHDHDVATPRLTPWVWAAASGLAGLSVLAWPAWPTSGAIATWGGVLVGLALLYAVYNRVDKPTRIWLGASSDPGTRSNGFYRALGWRPAGEKDTHGDEILVLPSPGQ